VKTLAKGASLTDAEIEAGYSSRNPGQSGFQALPQIRGRVPDLLEKHGLGEEILIEKQVCLKSCQPLRPSLKCNELELPVDAVGWYRSKTLPGGISRS
jgi:hypothetical protein